MERRVSTAVARTNNDSSQQAQVPGPANSQTQSEAQSGDKPVHALPRQNIDRMKQGKDLGWPKVSAIPWNYIIKIKICRVPCRRND